MTKEQALQLLWAQLQMDKRLMVHSLYEAGGVFKHTKSCERCCALYILGMDNEVDLSTE